MMQFQELLYYLKESDVLLIMQEKVNKRENFEHPSSNIIQSF